MFCKPIPTAVPDAILYYEQHPKYVKPCAYCPACLHSYLAAICTGAGNMPALGAIPCRNRASCGGALSPSLLQPFLEAHPMPARTTPASSSPKRLSRPAMSIAPETQQQQQYQTHTTPPPPAQPDYVMFQVYVERDFLRSHTASSSPSVPAVALFPSAFSAFSPTSSSKGAGASAFEPCGLVPRPVLIQMVPDYMRIT